MTNDESNPNDETRRTVAAIFLRNSGLVIPSSLDVRASSFSSNSLVATSVPHETENHANRQKEGLMVLKATQWVIKRLKNVWAAPEKFLSADSSDKPAVTRGDLVSHFAYQAPQ